MKVAAVLSAALLLMSATAFAQTAAPDAAQPPRPQQSPVFRSGSALVALNVSVQDAGAKYIGGLGPTTSPSTRTA